jgi:hypothetical protein
MIQKKHYMARTLRTTGNSQMYFLEGSSSKMIQEDSHVWSRVLVLASFFKQQVFDDMGLHHRKQTACTIT